MAKDWKKKQSLIDRVTLRLYEMFNKPKKKEELTTVRTKHVESGLKQAGLTDQDIARLRGKK